MFQKLILLITMITSMVANADPASSSPVPEPESISLMLLGLGLIGVIVFRQK
ncbi:MAG: PEP-CTERM sorting domain-containing protein [Methylophilus sp.]|uniref:PEP-CTERM sorting domain-containing protein n=1 Tax=Methylophilus sp. TaxID=29541 RepID=UPI00403695CE